MSIPLYLRARRASLRHPLKALLKELCFIADDAGGSIYPSIATLAQSLGLSDRGVQKCLDELQRVGYVSRPTQRAGGSHKHTAQYRLNLPMLPLTGEQDSPVAERVNGIHPTGEPRALTGEHGSLTGERGSPNRPDRPDRPAADQSNGNGNRAEQRQPANHCGYAAVPELSKFTSDELQMMWTQARGRNELGRLAEITAEIARRTNA